MAFIERVGTPPRVHPKAFPPPAAPEGSMVPEPDEVQVCGECTIRCDPIWSDFPNDGRLYGVKLPCTPNQLDGYDDEDEDKENQDPSGKGDRKYFL